MDDITNILFLDIETVPLHPNYDALPDGMKLLWERKSSYFRKEQTPAEVYEKAGIWAEFGKIVCISCGFIHKEKGNLRVKSFFNEDEKELLVEFIKTTEQFFEKKVNAKLCAHNGKEFDFPYIARRTIINGITLPSMFNVAGMKPWEVPYLDTLEMWKFGDHKHYTSLNLLTAILNIPSPKNDIDGSQVANVYYVEKDIERIVRYCEQDVLAIAQVMLRYKNLPLLSGLADD